MDSQPMNGSSPNVWRGVPAVNGVTGAKRAYGHTGHGFGPPATPADNNSLLAVLDLSSSTNRAESAPNTSARSPSSESTNDESGTLLTLRIQSQVKVETMEEESDYPVDETVDSCSRTLPRIPETWLQKLQQRKLNPPEVKAESSSHSDAEAVAMTPTPSPVSPPPVAWPNLAESKKKAVVKPNSQNPVVSSSSAAIPVGIAVARQRPESTKSSRSTPPKPHHSSSPYPLAPPDLSVNSTPPLPALNYGSLAAGRMYQTHDWAWSDPLHLNGSHSAPLLWPGADVASSVYGYPYGHPPAPPPPRPLSSSTTNAMGTSPFFLIPAACLDPYQRAAAAMLWSSYAPPSQPPAWNVDLAHPTAAAAWSHALHPAHLLDPISSTTGPSDSLFTEPPTAMPLSTSPIKSERLSPVEEDKIEPESNGYASNISPLLECKQEVVDETAPLDDQSPEVALPEVTLKAEPVEEADNFTGLHLLSDSIERFVSSIKKENSPPIRPPDASANPLDVLCAAALSEETVQTQAPTPVMPPQNEKFEFDFRSKLAELQRRYKEKQKELNKLKNLKRKDKEKKEKRKEKKKNKEKASALEVKSDAVINEAQCVKNSDLITPSRLHHPPVSASSAPDHPGDCKQEMANIKSSYAVVLAAAAVPAPIATASSGGGSAKKRKPDWPKRHNEQTETIVPKKRKLMQLLHWCNTNEEKQFKKKNAKKEKPKIKPKLKAEVQVKRVSSASSGCESEDETVERHCLPAMQYLQISDADSRPPSALSLVQPSPSLPSSPMLAPSESPPSPPASPRFKDSAQFTVGIVQEAPYEDRLPDKPSEEAQESGIVALTSCRLSQPQLQDGLRVLIAEDGLLHGGCVTCICPPDIYGVVVDGERGSRPRILSTEELLTEALLEVRPTGIEQLTSGTRLCAYWSQKSRCLYPGVVSTVFPATKGTGNRHLTLEDEVDVEFDDGDSGRIPLSHIRMLPQDYPVMGRPTNPLLALEGRRRRQSSVQTSITSAPKDPIEEKKVRKQESVDSASDKTQKKSQKKRRSTDSGEEVVPCELIIPVSPGEDPKETPDEARIMRNIRDTCSQFSAPPPRRAAAAAAAKSKQQTASQTTPPSGKNKRKTTTFFPDRQLWEWIGPSFKKASKGKGRKEFYKAIQRGQEIIRVGDCAVFLSSGRPDRPYVGRVELLWQSWGGSMTVKVRWFYHPEETCGGRRLSNLKTPGALFESNHADENDVQTISHGCLVLPLEEYVQKRKPDFNLNTESCYDLFYLAGFYDPTSGHLSFEPGVLETSH